MVSNEIKTTSLGVGKMVRKPPYKSVLGSVLGFFLSIFLTGCSVGPDFQRPSPPDIATYTPEPLKRHIPSVNTTLGNSQNLIEGKEIDREWWLELGSDKLNGLISLALESNPTLSAAQATLRQAQELYSARSGSTLYPQVDGNLGGQRQRFNPGALGQSGQAQEFSLYTAEPFSPSFSGSGGPNSKECAKISRPGFETPI